MNTAWGGITDTEEGVTLTMAKHGRLFVISGPAGAGKTEIVKRLLQQHPDVKLSVSCTTRAPRPGEVDGVNYHFVTEERFQSLIAEGAFYEWAHVHQNHYGTLKSTVQQELVLGHDLILEIDVQGCLQAMAQDPSVTGILEKYLENLIGKDRSNWTDGQMQVTYWCFRNTAPEHLQFLTELPNGFSGVSVFLTVYAVIVSRRLELDNHRDFLDALSTSLKS